MNSSDFLVHFLDTSKSTQTLIRHLTQGPADHPCRSGQLLLWLWHSVRGTSGSDSSPLQQCDLAQAAKPLKLYWGDEHPLKQLGQQVGGENLKGERLGEQIHHQTPPGCFR